MVDYPFRTRLKILAKAEIIELNNAPELYKSLAPKDYDFKPERMMVFSIEAYDWNCPQHIIPRFTISEIEDAFAGQRDYISKLEKEIKELRGKVIN